MAKKAYIGVDGKARKIKKGYVGVENFTKRLLPSGYTQVEYIESTGTQYINTGFNANNTTRVAASFAPIDSSSICVFGARGSGGNSAFMLYGSGSCDRAYGSSYGSTGVSFLTGKKNAADMNGAGKTITINGTDLSLTSQSSFTTPCPLFLFAFNDNGSLGGIVGAVRIYSCQIYDNGNLVRDFVPCKNSSGVFGLYDMANAAFYQNAGSGEFVVGATHSSFARKIKKAYIGIGGVARPCWSGGELAYYGTITPFSTKTYQLSAASVGNYGLFAGGYHGGYPTKVYAYDKTLVMTQPTALSFGLRYGAGTSVGSYALFGGGYTGSYQSVVNAYSATLTRSVPTALSEARGNLAATRVGNYALFGGGYTGASSPKATVDAYDTSLTRTTATALSVSRFGLTATTVGNYALFGGGASGSTSGTFKNTVDAYDTSLTRTTPKTLGSQRDVASATSVGNYALFGGGRDASYAQPQSNVWAYDKSLTRSNATALSVARYYLAATSVGDYALFGGGQNGNGDSYAVATVDAYDASLTRTLPTELNEKRTEFAATSVGDYALFGGGYSATSNAISTIVDAYVVA